MVPPAIEHAVDGPCPNAKGLGEVLLSTHQEGDQTFFSCCSDDREQLREIKKFGIQTPDSVSGWMLLRKSQLTLELVQFQVSTKMKTAKIEKAMYYLFGQDKRHGIRAHPQGW